MCLGCDATWVVLVSTYLMFGYSILVYCPVWFVVVVSYWLLSFLMMLAG